MTDTYPLMNETEGLHKKKRKKYEGTEKINEEVFLLLELDHPWNLPRDTELRT